MNQVFNLMLLALKRTKKIYNWLIFLWNIDMFNKLSYSHILIYEKLVHLNDVLHTVSSRHIDGII